MELPLCSRTCCEGSDELNASGGVIRALEDLYDRLWKEASEIGNPELRSGPDYDGDSTPRVIG